MIHINGRTPTELSVGVFFFLFVVGYFGDSVATRATAYTLRKGNFGQSLQGSPLCRKQGKPNKVFVITTHCFAMYCRRQTEKYAPPLYVFFSDLIWPGLFFSKSCFLHACWGRRTDFPAGSSTLKRGSRKVLWISKHVQFDCNIGKSIYSETVQNLHPHNVAQVWVGCRELVQAGSRGFMASTWNFYLNKRSQGPGRSVPFQSTTHRGQLKKTHFLIYVH